MEKLFSKCVFVWLLAALIGYFGLFPAAATEAPSDKTLSPYFYIKDQKEGAEASFPVKETEVSVTISGVIADVRVTQTYQNTGDQPINARYIFPASTRASVHGMTMTIGETRIKADIQKKKQAEKTFEAAKKEGKSASLLKQQRPNVFSMDVANIMPGDDIHIELHYSEFLVPADGTYEFVFPTVVGPRYSEIPAAGAPETDKWIQSPYLPEGEKPEMRFDITAEIAAGMPLQEIRCPSHSAAINWQNAGHAKVSLSPSEVHGGNRDFILQYRLSGRQIESGLLLHEGETENFFALMVQPPERVAPRVIPAREYVFVVDVSGSMNGFPLNNAKTLLDGLLGDLHERDRFNVILFADSARIMAPASVPATRQHIDQAIRLINHQRGGGGTRLLKALEKAVALPGDEGRSRSIVLVTDGYIAVEREVFALIENHLNTANVFSFGIGSSVNRYLVEGVAKAGLGEPFVVTDPNQAPAAAQKFRQYIASPVLTDIAVSYEEFDAYDVEPAAIPDLFAKRPVVVFGKWRGKAGGRIQITGKTGAGEYTRTINVSEAASSEVNRPLRYLWARSRVARLSDYNVEKGNAENEMAITSLGLTYNLLTRYTSFVAVHDRIRNTEGTARDIDQPLPLPKSVSHLAVGGQMARVPEPGLWPIMAGALIVMAMGVLRRRRYSGGHGR